MTRVVSLNQACPATPFLATYQGVHGGVRQVRRGLLHGVVTPIRGDAPATPAVPADAVTASGSGLDPQISPAYARLQAPGSPRPAASTVEPCCSADRRAHHRPRPRLHRRAGGQRARAQPRPGPAATRSTADAEQAPERREEQPMTARGQLRVYLGAAPGVGKTYTMLEEGHRRRDRGTDVVVGFVETPRPRRTPRRCSTAWRWCPASTLDLPRARRSPRWTSTPSWPARPQVALVDELAHTNVPGSPQRQALAGHRGAARRRHHRRSPRSTSSTWSRSTTSSQQITGVPQRETVPGRGGPRAPSRSSWST